ncbi:protein of unknown function [Candidatus Filomicrobium marinum]|nr:protein of unknown function [Candidatus Filomicrobium marinum]
MPGSLGRHPASASVAIAATNATPAPRGIVYLKDVIVVLLACPLFNDESVIALQSAIRDLGAAAVDTVYMSKEVGPTIRCVA